MPQLSILDLWTRRAALALVFGVIFGGAFWICDAALPDEPASDSVGIIDGAAISVSGPMRVESLNGLARTVLRSGSDVRVKSGTARLELVEGGIISICGPAHFSVLKSGKLLTVALDTGAIHAYLPAPAGTERAPALTIYTPQIQAQTVGIGDGPQDALVGFDEAGAMCIHAYRGAIRVEQQLTGQSVLVPQSGNVMLVNGQLDELRAGAERCSCDPQLSKYAPPPPPEVSPPAATTEEARPKPSESATEIAPVPLERPASKDEPIYQVFMPPLIYNAKATVQPEIDPNTIVLVRRVRVRPTLIFQGRVKGQAVAPATKPSAPKTPSSSAARGDVRDQVLPDVSEKALATIQGTVHVGVRVHVDAAGNVSQAEFDSPGSSAFFAHLALKAAQRWQFSSPEVDGRSVPSEWIIRFEFTPSGTQAFPKQTAIFHGRVEGQAVAPATKPSAPPPAPARNPAKAAAPANDSFVGRVRHFVHRLWSSGS